MTFIGSHVAFRKAGRRSRTEQARHWLIRFIEKNVYLIGFSAIIANIPQLYNVWVASDTSGVSLLSWLGFLIGAMLWFCYGWLHRDRLIMFVNGSIIVIQAGIVLGLLIR